MQDDAIQTMFQAVDQAVAGFDQTLAPQARQNLHYMMLGYADLPSLPLPALRKKIDQGGYIDVRMALPDGSHVDAQFKKGAMAEFLKLPEEGTEHPKGWNRGLDIMRAAQTEWASYTA